MLGNVGAVAEGLHIVRSSVSKIQQEIAYNIDTLAETFSMGSMKTNTISKYTGVCCCHNAIQTRADRQNQAKTRDMIASIQKKNKFLPTLITNLTP